MVSTGSGSFPLMRVLRELLGKEDHTQLSRPLTGYRIPCRCSLLESSIPADQTTSAMFLLAVTAPAIVHDGLAL